MSTNGLKRIHTKDELKALAKELGVRNDWHEPDEQGLRAFVFGKNFDNAGHWGLEFLSTRELHARKSLWNPKDTVEGGIIENAEEFVEMFVVLYQHDKAVAEIDLATLFAFACDTYAG